MECAGEATGCAVWGVSISDVSSRQCAIVQFIFLYLRISVAAKSSTHLRSNYCLGLATTCRKRNGSVKADEVIRINI